MAINSRTSKNNFKIVNSVTTMLNICPRKPPSIENIYNRMIGKQRDQKKILNVEDVLFVLIKIKSIFII